MRPITRALHPERADCIVYTEKGQVRCRCPSTGEQRDMAFSSQPAAVVILLAEAT